MKICMLCLSLLLILKSEAQQKNFENLIFEGAGIRGIAYAGVVKELETANLISQIQKVGGTSAGAITALMVALGYSADEIYALVSKTKFQKFNDGKYFFAGGMYRLASKFGWYRGKAFEKWLEKIIVAKTGNKDITFRNLPINGFKSLYITATCLNRQKLLVFSPENYPNMKIKDAVRISMSIPLYFEAVFIDSTGKVYSKSAKNKSLDVVVDGGILGNFPIFIFDSLVNNSQQAGIRIPNPNTIGVRIDSDAQIEKDAQDKSLAPIEINGIRDYFTAFYTLVLENLNRNKLMLEDWQRTISVSSLDIGPKIKKLSDAQKRNLMQSGSANTLKFLHQHQLIEP